MDRFITFTVPPFPTYIASGKGVFHQGERHISRTFTVFDLLYVTKGELWMTEGEEAFHVKEGEYTILSPGLSHGGHLPCEEETHYEWLHFSIDRFELTNRLREHWIDMKQNQATFEKPATYEFSLPRLGKVKGRSVLEKHLSAMRALNHGASELPLKNSFYLRNCSFTCKRKHSIFQVQRRPSHQKWFIILSIILWRNYTWSSLQRNCTIILTT